MKHTHRILSVVLVLSMLLSMVPMVAAQTAAAEIYDLRVNDLVEPLGIDENPSFSWKMKSDAIGAAQTAYAITVADGETQVWNSGWVEDSDSTNIPYAGETALEPATVYTVTVQVKDQTGAETAPVETTFETGLMDEGFGDADWITYQGKNTEVISNTTKYTIDFDMTLNLGAAGFSFGVTDYRNLYMWQLSSNDTTTTLTPHFKTNGSWSKKAYNITEAVGGSVLGKTFHMTIEVDGAATKTWMGESADQMKLVCEYTHSASLPLKNLGFRHNSTDSATYDNIVVKDAAGDVLYAEDFSEGHNTVLLHEKTGDSHASVTDGKLTIAASSNVGEHVYMLDNDAVTSYTIDFDFILDSSSQGFCFGMTDTDSYMMWQLNAWKQRSGSKAVLLRPHHRSNGAWIDRSGMSGTTIKDFDVTAALGYTTDDVFGKLIHQRIVVDGANIKTYFGPDAENLTLALDLNYQREIPSAGIGFRQCASSSDGAEIARYDNFKVTDSEGNVLLEEDFSEEIKLVGKNFYAFKDGMLEIGTTDTSVGEFVNMLEEASGSESNLPAYRRSFTPAKEVASARLYTTGLGVYTSWINGQRVGNLTDNGVVYDELTPGATQNNKRMFYNTYDVTWMLNEGENVLSAVVSEGWWSGEIVMNYGKTNAYMAKLVLTYTDGTTETIVTDTETWKTARASALQAGTGIFNGERYDARVDQSWMLPGYNVAEWGVPMECSEFGGEVSAWDGVNIVVRKDLERAAEDIYVYDGVTGNASGYHGTVNKVRTYTDGDAIVVNPGETLLVDFGQNFAGWEAFEYEAEEGTTIHVEHGEMLNDGNGATSRGNDGPEGSIYNENYRGISADTIFITGKGGTSYHPTHTFYGFRYIEITVDKPVTFTKITGQVVTSAQEDTGFITTSDADVNQLVHNTRWGMYSNYLSIPTDCPQRNERSGWTNDTLNFAEAGSYLNFSKSFLEKWLQDMRDGQRSDGAYLNAAPLGHNGRGYGALGWADAGVLVTHYLYRMYGDTQTIRDNWASMRLFMDTYMAGTNKYGGAHNYGDWLSPESNDTTIKNMMGISYFAWDALAMADMAAAIGETEAAAHYQAVYEEEKAFFQSLYVKEDGSLSRGEQTPCLYALYLNLLPNEESVAKVTEQLISGIENNGNKIGTGFLGTAIINNALSDIGRDDVAYRLLLQHDYPSWLYSVDQGATTIWERWNSYTLESGFGPVSMNSFNHYSFGAVVSWMFRDVAGIGWDAETPGFQRIVLAPNPDRSLPVVEASYDSVYGEIATKSVFDGNVWNFEATIPANTTAKVMLPLESEDCILTVNGKAAADLTLAEDGLTFVGIEGEKAVFEAVACTFTAKTERDPQVLAKEETDKALEALKPYQTTNAINTSNTESVQTLIDNAKAAVEAYEAAGGVAMALDNYSWIAGAEMALALQKTMNEATQFTIDFDFVLTSSSQGFCFSMDNTTNFALWQFNAWKNRNSDKALLLRPHIQVNGSWVDRGNVSGSLLKDTNVSAAVGYDTETIFGNQVHQRVIVDGANIQFWFGPDAENLKLGYEVTYSRELPLLHLGVRHNSNSGDGYEVASYDNFVVTDGEGNVIYTEDFSDASKVSITGNAIAKYATVADGVLTVGANTTAEGQVYVLGKVCDPIAAAAEVDAMIEAIDTAESVVAARAAYDALLPSVQEFVTKLADLEAAEKAQDEEVTDVILTVTGPETIQARDEEVTYTLSGKDMKQLANMILTFDISDEYLTDPVITTAEGWAVLASSWKEGKLNVALYNLNGANGEGDILSVTLKIADQEGNATVALTEAELVAYQGEGEVFVNAVLEGASVTTEVKRNPYDVNKDGVVDQLDMTRCQRYYGQYHADADVNADGEVDVTDVILILLHYNENFRTE